MGKRLLNRETLQGKAFFNEKKWNEEAPFYDFMNSLEAEGTLKELEILPLNRDDVVLDIGCGPGRMTIPLAKMVKKVIAIDFAEDMVELCIENCRQAGVTNVECKRIDWQDGWLDTSDYEVDVAIQARWGAGASPFEMFRKVARRYAVIIDWARNPPRVARSKLFEGCYSEESMEKYPELRPFDRDVYEELKLSKDDDAPVNRRAELKRTLDGLGIELVSKTVESGWHFQSHEKEEIIDKLLRLSPHPELVDRARFASNLDRYIRKSGLLWDFYFPTWTEVKYFRTRN